MTSEKLKFGLFDQQQVKVVPTFVEKENSGKPYLSYGQDNRFPNYLWDLYLRSALLQSIVEGTANYVGGDGLVWSEDPTVQRLKEEANADGETLEDIIKKITVDYLIFGGFSLQLIYNKLGELNEIYWLDFRNVRLDKEGKKAYYSEDWIKHANDYETYDVFDPKDEKRHNTVVFYFKGHVSRGVYPIPRYNGALSALETSTEISKYHLNAIRNNFNGNFIINFNNGQPTDDVQEEIERKLKDKFGGAENAGKFMVSFNDSKDNGVTVERIQDDKMDEKYKNLRQDTYKEIFVAFRATSNLFGYNLEGTGFSQQEYEEAYKLYEKATVQPMQRDIKRCFNRMFGKDLVFDFIPFSLEPKAKEQEA